MASYLMKSTEVQKLACSEDSGHGENSPARGVQTLQCELCDNTCYSLASLQHHYNKCHFASASGKRAEDGGRFVKTTPGNTRLGEESEDRGCLVNNDSGLGEENPPGEDILTASGPKLMFR